MAVGDAEHRLRRLEDRAQLRELVDRYCLAIDDSDWDALLEMFASPAEMAGVTGRDEVVGHLRAIRSGYGRTIHTVTGQVLDFADDDHASGVVASRGELAISGRTVLCAMRYLDNYERAGGSWRFTRRVIQFSYALPWSEMTGAMTDQLAVRWPGTEAVSGS